MDWALLLRDVIPRSESCTCTELNPLRFYRYDDPERCSELARTVIRNDLITLERIVSRSRIPLIHDRYANTPLHMAILLNKIDVFDFMLGLPDINVDAVNSFHQTPMHIAATNPSEYYVTRLLEKGAVVSWLNDTNCIPLHAAATQGFARNFEILLQNGAEINAKNRIGRTALHHACHYGSVESVYMCLYHGASATIPDRYGLLPLGAIMRKFRRRKQITSSDLECHKILFDFTFDQPTIISLKNLSVAMKIDSPLVPDMISKVKHLRYTNSEVRHLSRSAFMIRPAYFKLFMDKFPHIVEKLVEDPIILQCALNSKKEGDLRCEKLVTFLTMLFEYKPDLNFIKGATDLSFVIPYLIALYKEGHITAAALKRTVFFFYSYGLPCEMIDLVMVYETCGFCDIVKLQLEMDITATFEKPRAAMPYLIHDVHMTIDKFIRIVQTPHADYKAALRFFCRPTVRNFFDMSPEFQEILKQIPTVPSLIELTRDVARKYIIDIFQIGGCRDFYRLVSKIPISEVYKRILTYEKKLYHFE